MKTYAGIQPPSPVSTTHDTPTRAALPSAVDPDHRAHAARDAIAPVREEAFALGQRAGAAAHGLRNAEARRAQARERASA